MDVMKVNRFNIKTVKNADGSFELDFIRDGKSMFCMDAKISGDAAKRYVEKLERYASDCYPKDYKMNLMHTSGDRINIEFENDFGYSNALETNLVISYPTDRNGAVWYNDRKATVMKMDFLEAFYKAFLTISIDAKSELLESIINMNDLESYYERIA